MWKLSPSAKKLPLPYDREQRSREERSAPSSSEQFESVSIKPPRNPKTVKQGQAAVPLDADHKGPKQEDSPRSEMQREYEAFLAQKTRSALQRLITVGDKQGIADYLSAEGPIQGDEFEPLLNLVLSWPDSAVREEAGMEIECRRETGLSVAMRDERLRQLMRSAAEAIKDNERRLRNGEIALEGSALEAERLAEQKTALREKLHAERRDVFNEACAALNKLLKGPIPMNVSAVSLMMFVCMPGMDLDQEDANALLHRTAEMLVAQIAHGGYFIMPKNIDSFSLARLLSLSLRKAGPPEDKRVMQRLLDELNTLTPQVPM